MYHELTDKKRARIGYGRVLAAALVVLVLALSWIGVGTLVARAREQGATSMREAILTSAERCCAVEGSYPPSVSYLEQNYGLQLNTRDYVVTYQTFASNVMPSVVVVPR